MSATMSTRPRGIKRYSRNNENDEGDENDKHNHRRVSVKLPNPTTFDECKKRLLSNKSRFILNNFINRSGQIDPASLRNFIRVKNILSTSSQFTNDMFQTYLSILNFLHRLEIYE